MTPVVGWMVNPDGRPVAVHVRLSPLGSVKNEAVANENAVASTPDWVAMPVVVGGWFPEVSKPLRAVSTRSLLLEIAEVALK